MHGGSTHGEAALTFLNSKEMRSQLMSAGLKLQLLKNQRIMHPTIHSLTTIPLSNLIEISGRAKLVCSHSANETHTLFLCPPRSSNFPSLGTSLTLLFSMNMSPLFFTVISPESPQFIMRVLPLGHSMSYCWLILSFPSPSEPGSWRSTSFVFQFLTVPAHNRHRLQTC